MTGRQVYTSSIHVPSIMVYVCIQILERSKYDEERDEWILPFAKKKLLREGTSTASGASMLPDIFNKGQAESSRSDPAFVAKTNAGMPSNSNLNRRASSSRESSRQNSNNNSSSNNNNRLQQTNSKPAIVPLLTLPGTTISTAASSSAAPTNSNSRGDTLQGIAATAGTAESSRKNYAKESSRLQSSLDTQQGQGRSTAEQKKRKTSRPKEQDSQEQEATFSFDDSNAYNSSRASADPEAGSGVAAGPLLEWGFVGAASSHDRGIGYSGPELVYSDDDDFETAEDGMNGNSSSRHSAMGFNAAPFPPTHGSSSQQGGNKGRKKKKKSSSSSKAADQSGSSYEKPSTVTSLPPI